MDKGTFIILFIITVNIFIIHINVYWLIKDVKTIQAWIVEAGKEEGEASHE